MTHPLALSVLLLIAAAVPLPVSAASLTEVPDDEIVWCTLEFGGGFEVRAPKGSAETDPMEIVLLEVADAQPGTELFLELEFGDRQTRSCTGAVDEHADVPVFEAPRSLLADLTKVTRWTYRLDQRQSVGVDEQLPADILKGFERCTSQK